MGARAVAGVAFLSILAAVGCTTATPRFPVDVQTAVVHGDMQRLETEQLVLYYPRGKREPTLRAAKKLEYCRREIDKLTHVKNDIANEKPVLVMPTMPFNNAYVDPVLAHEQIAVLPQFATLTNYFALLGLPPDPGIIGCHELVHDRHGRQVRGGARGMRHVLGNLYSPQLGFDAWFWEGLAVFHETKLLGIGRLADEYFDGHFAAGIQGERLDGTELHAEKRGVRFGAHYLVGSHFVEYLARRYGEDRLWGVVEEQANDLLFPFNINGTFRNVYGKSLSTLIDEFDIDSKQRYAPRARPRDQRALRRLPQVANVVRARSGHTALLTQGPDDLPRVTVLDGAGREVVSHLLKDFGVGRRLVAPAVELMNGLSITPDGRHVYFAAIDAGSLFSQAKLLHLDVAEDSLRVVHEDLWGSGGSISADGQRYYFARAHDDAYALHVLDLRTQAIARLSDFQPGRYHTSPVVSPDGSRLLVTEVGDDGVRLALYDARFNRRLGDVAAPPGMVFEGSWVDDQRVVFTASDGRWMQAFEADLNRKVYRKLTDAPYVVSKPFSDGQTLRFLNREGWAWTLDEAPHPPAAAGSAEFVPRTAQVRWVAALQLPILPARDEPAAPTADSPPTDSPPAAAPEEAPTAEPPDPTRAEPAPAPAPAPTVPNPLPSTVSTAYRNRLTPRFEEVTVVSEEPYSGHERLFIPQVWGPLLQSRGTDGASYGAFLNGGDRLGYHRWGLGAGYDSRAKLPSGGISYINSLAAPWLIGIELQHIGHREEKAEDLIPNPGQAIRIRETVGELAIGRTFFGGTTVAAGARYVDADYELEASTVSIMQHRFAGPTLSFVHRDYTGTEYSSPRLGYGLGGGATYFPESFSETADFSISDVQGAAGIVLPLPISKRHTLRLEGTFRGLLGVPDDVQLLQIGGGGNQPLPVKTFQEEEPIGDRSAGLLPPQLRFFQPLRGFENYALFGQYAAGGEATYRYPFIIDWGSATSLRIFPAFLLRQIDLDLFFAGTSLIKAGREEALAVGAALTVRLSIWKLPLSVRFQEARRLTYDEKLAFFFSLEPG